MIKPIIFGIILVTAIVILYINLWKLFGYFKVAKKEKRWDNPGKRLWHMLVVGFGQSKIFRDGVAGPMHAAIFWGFMILLFSAVEGVIQGFYHEFSWAFLGPVYTMITFFTDIFSVLIILAIFMALFRRYVYKVKRLQGDKSEVVDAIIVLSMIFLIVGSLIIEKASFTVIQAEPEWGFNPIASAIGTLIPLTTASGLYEICWWLHVLAILFFSNYLPFSKHFHVFTSIPNVFFSPTEIPNKLPMINFEEEGVEKFGIVDIDDLHWKNIMDSYSCTHCGRCTSVCPANQTGKILDPRQIIVEIRERTLDAAPIFMKKMKAMDAGLEFIPTEEEQKILDKKFVGDYQNIEALWQCTSCGACMQECPVTIEHVPAIIGMRRNLVMMEADFPPELQPAFSNLENNASPWAFSPAERGDWAQGTGIKTCAEDPDFDVLFWVGCAGSFDDRSKKIALAFSKLMQIAGVNFRILGSEEQCTGDPARRSGNEYLANTLVRANVETLAKYNVEKIVTFCPHCLNTLKNEYPDFGGNYEVTHHTVFLQQLLDEGKLKIKENGHEPKKIAYHDSCYLGRYNQIYDEPRNNLKRIPGVEVLEASKSRDKGLCCGAGGARMFMEETKGTRVNHKRTDQLLETGASCIAVNCPFCMTMLTDGIKDKNRADEVEVKDIAEILLESIEE